MAKLLKSVRTFILNSHIICEHVLSQDVNCQTDEEKVTSNSLHRTSRCECTNIRDAVGHSRRLKDLGTDDLHTREMPDEFRSGCETGWWGSRGR